MEISCENKKAKIKQLVERYSKYQKVMLVYDEFVSNSQINEIYLEIKDDCVFNKCEIKKLGNEIFDGYKLLIFLTSANNYLDINLNLDEFFCIFCPTDKNILPFLLFNSLPTTVNGVVLQSPDYLETGLHSSLCLNRLLSHLSRLFNQLPTSQNFDYLDQEINQTEMVKNLFLFEGDLFFVDVDIIKKTKIDYKHLQLVDLMIVNALQLVFESIKNKMFSIVDVYKIAKDNTALVEKFYAISQNQAFFDLVNLNYNFLLRFVAKTKQRILDSIDCFETSEKEIQFVSQGICEYAKNNSGIISYLYFYGAFDC